MYELWQFVCRLAEEILGYSSAAMPVALVQSYLTIMSHIHAPTHLLVLTFWEEEGKFTYVVFNTQDAFTLVSFIWNAAQTTS